MNDGIAAGSPERHALAQRIDRFVKGLDQTPVQAPDVLGGEVVRAPVIAQPGREQNLVRVHGTDAADEVRADESTGAWLAAYRCH